MFENEIQSELDELIKQCLEDRIFILGPHDMAYMKVAYLENILRLVVEAKHHQRLLETAQDKDAMADLQILLWQIKQEKEK